MTSQKYNPFRVSWAERKALCAETIRADCASWLLFQAYDFWLPLSFWPGLKDSVKALVLLH